MNFKVLILSKYNSEIIISDFFLSKIVKNAIKNYQKQEIPATFYIHSWELTPEYMPKIQLSVKENFVTYHNIGKAYTRMSELLQQFQFTSFSNFISEG